MNDKIRFLSEAVASLKIATLALDKANEAMDKSGDRRNRANLTQLRRSAQDLQSEIESELYTLLDN